MLSVVIYIRWCPMWVVWLGTMWGRASGELISWFTVLEVLLLSPHRVTESPRVSVESVDPVVECHYNFHSINITWISVCRNILQIDSIETTSARNWISEELGQLQILMPDSGSGKKEMFLILTNIVVTMATSTTPRPTCWAALNIADATPTLLGGAEVTI